VYGNVRVRLSLKASPVAAARQPSRACRCIFYSERRVYERTKGHFESERRSHCWKAAGNAWKWRSHCYSVYQNALWTARRTIFRPKYTRFQDCGYTISKFFRGWYPWPQQKCPRCLDPDTNFRLTRRRSLNLFLFYETTIAVYYGMVQQVSSYRPIRLPILHQ